MNAIAAATQAFTLADNIWRQAVRAKFGPNNNAAYEPRGRGEPGTELRRLYEEREAASKVYHEAWSKAA